MLSFKAFSIFFKKLTYKKNFYVDSKLTGLKQPKTTFLLSKQKKIFLKCKSV